MARIRLLASLREAAGTPEISIEGSRLAEALKDAIRRLPILERVIDPESLEPRPGYIVFVDGVDIRLVDKNTEASEIVVLPVNHGGEAPESLTVEEVSWTDIEELVDIVSKKVVASGFEPDAIVGIIRGGIVPARLLADRLTVDDIFFLEIKLYEGVGVRGRRPFLRQPLVGDLRGRRVLVVDDISDTGLTLQLAQEIIGFYMPSEIRTATLYIKPWTSVVPDYYGVSTESWIVFPWERHEYRRLISQNKG